MSVLDPWVRRSRWSGKWLARQCSCLETFLPGGALLGCSPWEEEELDRTEYPHIHFLVHSGVLFQGGPFHRSFGANTSVSPLRLLGAGFHKDSSGLHAITLRSARGSTGSVGQARLFSNSADRSGHRG